MIESIHGILTGVNTGGSYIIVRDGGMSYRICVTKSFAANLFGQVSNIVDIVLHQVISETKWTLYGFQSDEDREVFLDLVGVPGVGAATAMNIMDMGIPECCLAINQGDVAMLTKIKGIGPKTAKQVVSDLKGKMPMFDLPQSTMPIESVRDAELALIRLGKKSPDAKRMISQALDENPDITTTEQLITKSLLYNVRTS